MPDCISAVSTRPHRTLRQAPSLNNIDMASLSSRLRTRLRTLASALAAWARRRPAVKRAARRVFRRAPRLYNALARELLLPAAVVEPAAEAADTRRPPNQSGQLLTSTSSELDRACYSLLRAIERHSP